MVTKMVLVLTKKRFVISSYITYLINSVSDRQNMNILIQFKEQPIICNHFKLIKVPLTKFN